MVLFNGASLLPLIYTFPVKKATFYSFLFSLLLASIRLPAQDPADISHQTIDLDSINQFELDIYSGDTYEVRSWPGDDVLVETSVVLNNGKAHILKFFLQKNRWSLQPLVKGDQLTLKSKDKVRKIVQGTEGTTSETVNIVLYIPEDFELSGGSYRRKRR